MELFHAANQWANRPDDERFDSLEEMYRATRDYAEIAREVEVPFRDLRVEAQGDDMVVGRGGAPAALTNFAFGQLARKASAPAGYLRELPATLAAQNLNYGLKRSGGEASLLMHTNGQLLLRAATSTRYSRIWNYELVARLIDFSERHGLVPAQQTMTWGGGEVPEDADKALYASDHDMFAFIMSPDRVVTDPQGEPLRRGVIVQNSEVGDKSLAFMGFWFRDVCANHIIWGAEKLAEVRIRHVGEARGKMMDAVASVRQYLDSDTSLDQARFQEVTVKIADTKEEVLDKLFGMRSLGIARKTLDASYEAVVPAEDGDPRTAWGMAQGITRLSQGESYAENRVALDRSAGKLLAAF